jgi:hypothetical protein
VGNASTSALVVRVQGLIELLNHIVREIGIPLMLLLDMLEMPQDLIGRRLVRQRIVADGDRGLDDLLLHPERTTERLEPVVDNRKRVFNVGCLQWIREAVIVEQRRREKDPPQVVPIHDRQGREEMIREG